MANIRIPLWIFGVVGIIGVFLLANYISGQFKQASAIEDQAMASGLYIDTPPPPTKASSSELKRIDVWIKTNNLNKYGEPTGTKYKNGEPLYKGNQKIFTNRFHYIIVKHPDRPWNNGTAVDEHVLIDKWISDNGLNEFGDQNGTMYTGGTPLFDATTGLASDKYLYIEKNHPDRPWAK